jgi:hypothetical protein
MAHSDETVALSGEERDAASASRNPDRKAGRVVKGKVKDTDKVDDVDAVEGDPQGTDRGEPRRQQIDLSDRAVAPSVGPGAAATR